MQNVGLGEAFLYKKKQIGKILHQKHTFCCYCTLLLLKCSFPTYNISLQTNKNYLVVHKSPSKGSFKKDVHELGHRRVSDESVEKGIGKMLTGVSENLRKTRTSFVNVPQGYKFHKYSLYQKYSRANCVLFYFATVSLNFQIVYLINTL